MNPFREQVLKLLCRRAQNQARVNTHDYCLYRQPSSFLLLSQPVIPMVYLPRSDMLKFDTTDKLLLGGRNFRAEYELTTLKWNLWTNLLRYKLQCKMHHDFMNGGLSDVPILTKLSSANEPPIVNQHFG